MHIASNPVPLTKNNKKFIDLLNEAIRPSLAEGFVCEIIRKVYLSAKYIHSFSPLQMTSTLLDRHVACTEYIHSSCPQIRNKPVRKFQKWQILFV